MHLNVSNVRICWILCFSAATLAALCGPASASTSAVAGTPVASIVATEATAQPTAPPPNSEEIAPTTVVIEPATTEAPETPVPSVTIPPTPQDGADQVAATTPAPPPPPPMHAAEPSAAMNIKLRLDRISFSAIAPSDAPTFSTGVIALSYAGAPPTGGWSVSLTFDDFVPSQLGPTISASHLTLVQVSGSGPVVGSQSNGVITLAFAPGADQPTSGSVTVTVRLDMPNPVVDSVYRSQITATAISMNGD